MTSPRAASCDSPTPTPDFSIPAERTRYISDSLRRLRTRSQLDASEANKLFSDLLDDVDSISSPNSDSARRRKKARVLFSDWLFNSSDPNTAPLHWPLMTSLASTSAQPTPAAELASQEVGFAVWRRPLTSGVAGLC